MPSEPSQPVELTAFSNGYQNGCLTKATAIYNTKSFSAALTKCNQSVIKSANDTRTSTSLSRAFDELDLESPLGLVMQNSKTD